MAQSSEAARSPFVTKLSLVAASLLCLLGATRYYRFETAYQMQNPDRFIAPQMERLSGLVTTLPESAVVGYVTDAPAGSAADSAMFLSAQYVLAPRLLDRKSNKNPVVGNFLRPGGIAGFAESRKLRIERDFGNGVVLFQREN
jgi:hypothetical protein